MANPLDKQLERWVSAGVVDATTAARIRTLEQSQGSGESLRWPVLLAVALGGLLLGAGVLLFVAAHWDELSPAWRFTLVLVLVAVFPIAGAMTEERFPALSTTFYTLGTICVGAGICLTAHVFNLQARLRPGFFCGMRHRQRCWPCWCPRGWPGNGKCAPWVLPSATACSPLGCC